MPESGKMEANNTREICTRFHFFSAKLRSFHSYFLLLLLSQLLFLSCLFFSFLQTSQNFSNIMADRATKSGIALEAQQKVS